MISNFVNKRFDKWLKRRIPANKEITLGSGNLFIFPSKAGIHFLLSCFILFLLGTNYQNNLILFMVFFLCSFMVTCLLLSFRNVSQLTLSALDSEAQFAGKSCQFRLRLKHERQKAQDLFFCFQNHDSDLQPIKEGDTIILYAFAKQRGYFRPGRIKLRSSFPFGLYNVWTHIDFDAEVLIYPKPIKNNIQSHSISKNNSDQSVNQTAHGVDQFSTLKSYQPGESLKSIAWKQLAQGRGWLSKQFEQSVSAECVLDISLLGHLPLEMRVSYLCYHVIELEKQHLRYALVLPNQEISLGTGAIHKHRCLKALALFQTVSDRK